MSPSVKGPFALAVAAFAIAVALLIVLTIGPRRLDPDVLAGIAVGVLIGGALDAVLPYVVRAANRVMRATDRDDRR